MFKVLLFYLICRVILELEELQESQVPLVKRYVSSDDKKGISCSDSPHQIVSFIWLEQLNEWNLFLANSGLFSDLGGTPREVHCPSC